MSSSDRSICEVFFSALLADYGVDICIFAETKQDDEVKETVQVIMYM